MEFRRVVGNWRSVRFFNPDKPVDRGSIQAVLEAGRLASRAMNVAWAKAVVAYRDELSAEERNSLKSAYATVEWDLAPVYVLWYFDTGAQRQALAQRRYPTVPSGAIQAVGGLAPPHGWSRKYLEDVVLPEVLIPFSEGPRGGGHPDVGVAIGQALLCAVDEGLGACLVPFEAAPASRIFHVPDSWEPALALLLGHSLEAPEAGGQRPRPALETVAFERDTTRPSRLEPEMARQLKADGLIQPAAPCSWRFAELKALARGLKLTQDAPAAAAADASDAKPAFATTSTVRTWLASYQETWREALPEREAFAVLDRFVKFCGTEPDAIISEVFKTNATGEGVTLRNKARRKYMKLIDDFERQEGSRTRANYVRSFMIHNGVAMNPDVLK